MVDISNSKRKKGGESGGKRIRLLSSEEKVKREKKAGESENIWPYVAIFGRGIKYLRKVNPFSNNGYIINGN